MPILFTLGLCLVLRQSQVRALESDLKSALRGVSINSKQLREIVARVVTKYQKGLSEPRGSLGLERCFGPTQMMMGHFVLENDKFNVDGSFDQANFAFWPTQLGIGVQLLDGWSEAGEKDPDYLVGEAFSHGDRLIRCGAATSRGNRCWPGVRIYRLERGR